MPKKKTSRRKTTRKKASSRRVLSGLSGTRRKKRSSKKGCKRVSRKAATHRSGKNKGRLKKGCKFIKGDGAQCCPSGGTRKRSTKRRGKKKSSRKKSSRKKSSTSKQHIYSAKSRAPYYKGTKKLKKGCTKVRSGKNRGKVACKRKVRVRRRRAA